MITLSSAFECGNGKRIQQLGEDRFRIEIDSYLPEAYNFELMDDLPEGLHDYLWVRLHPSSYGNQ